jgi:hypothetical protein
MSEPIVNVYCARADRDRIAIEAMQSRERNAQVIAFKRKTDDA